MREASNGVKAADWDTVDIPVNLAFKWLAICTFEKPRFATLCTTRYTSVGRVELDRKIGIAAIQGHTVVDAHSFWQLLVWRIVHKRYNGIHCTFGFHATTAATAQLIMQFRRDLSRRPVAGPAAIIQ